MITATDLHVHGWTFPEIGKGEWIIRLLEGKGERTLRALVKACKKRFLYIDTLIGLTNFDDRTTYELILSTLENQERKIFMMITEMFSMQ